MLGSSDLRQVSKIARMAGIIYNEIIIKTNKIMWNYMASWGGYGYGGGFMGLTMLLVWAVLILLVVLLWQKINNK